VNRRNPAGVIVLIIAMVIGLALTATFSVGRAYRSVSDPAMGLPERPAFVPAPDPILRAEAGLEPNSTDQTPGPSTSTIRTIQVFPQFIYLTQGGQITRSISLRQPITTPDQLVQAVNDEEWISKSSAAEVLVHAALLMEPGTELVAAAPLRRIVLETKPGVFLGASEATLTFDGVAVEASDRAVPKDGEVGPGTRPFVVAEGGRMEIRNSSFRYLGRDWNCSYGVSWMKGATGSARGSVFEHGFIGVFTDKANDVRFDHNFFRDNTLYGINSYTLSAGLLVESNVAERNGRHGILLSEHVTGGDVRNNISRNNGLNGIMLDENSDLNVIRGNVVEGNRGDGIVVSNSSKNRIVDNAIRNNRIAINVYGVRIDGNIARGNIIDGNGLATQGIDPAGDIIKSNGDHWQPLVLGVIWPGALFLVWVLYKITRWSQRTRNREIDRLNQERASSQQGVAQ
jgi:poly(beta-D-mannuronate) C5 epimerase